MLSHIEYKIILTCNYLSEHQLPSRPYVLSSRSSSSSHNKFSTPVLTIFALHHNTRTFSKREIVLPVSALIIVVSMAIWWFTVSFSKNFFMVWQVNPHVVLKLVV